MIFFRDHKRRRRNRVVKLVGILDPIQFCIFIATFLQSCMTSVMPGVFGFWNNIASLASSTASNPANIGAKFMSDMMSRPNSDLILTMNSPMEPIIASFSRMTFTSREEHVTAMVAAMQAAAIASQAPVMAALQAFNIQTESYWLTNQIYIKGATPPIVQALMAISAIRNIAEEKKIPLMPIFNRTTGVAPNGTLWNVKKINAHRLWKEGVKGEGIVVAGIDTGVRGSHHALKENYVGTENFGWFDPILYTNEPNDIQGHGTHTVGTMVGTNGIGAAPRAKWMACKGCGMQSCLQHALIACGQFILCPTDPRSKKLNCSHVPHIVNNSWGGPGGQTWYDDVIAAWRAVGIIPFFANGNNGPQCETAGSPGDSEDVIAVGATDKDDRLARFSSRGPKVTVVGGAGLKGQDFFSQVINMMGRRKKVTDHIKPDISAPGHQINSAGIMTDNSYKVQSGTSMATPLTAGAGALLLSKNPKLTLEEMKHLMYTTAEHRLTPTGSPQCGPIVETEYPNHMYGHGRLNIYKAYRKMVRIMKQRELEAGKRSSGKEPDPIEGSDSEYYDDEYYEEKPTKRTPITTTPRTISLPKPAKYKPASIKRYSVKASSEEDD